MLREHQYGDYQWDIYLDGLQGLSQHREPQGSGRKTRLTWQRMIRSPS
jgi:hypothetical protein